MSDAHTFAALAPLLSASADPANVLFVAAEEPTANICSGSLWTIPSSSGARESELSLPLCHVARYAKARTALDIAA